jgi:hypothetical protein
MVHCVNTNFSWFKIVLYRFFYNQNSL